MSQPTPQLLEQLHKLGTLDCTAREAAAYLGMSEQDHAALMATPEAAEAFERGRLLGNVAIRQRQLSHAKTNAGMAIHLGKKRLGQEAAQRPAAQPAAQVIPLRGFRRPMPPEEFLSNPTGPRFIASPQLATWFRSVFIDEGGALVNPEHGHLQQATIGALWTNVGNSRAGRRIVGQAEMGDPGGTMGKWAKERARQQVEEWFGTIPDFIMTIDAHYVADDCDDASFCALIEHELMHMAQEMDEFGAPKFRKDGRPALGIRGHDVEEFVGVVRRYGSRAAGVEALVEAANRGPEIAPARIAQACGTCLGKRAA
jgi:hypothetical protein